MQDVTIEHRPIVCVLGASLDVDNRGVRALGVSLAQLFDRVFPGIELVFLYGNESGGSRQLSGGGLNLEVKVRNCRMSPRSPAGQHIFVILFLALLHRLGIRDPARRNPWLRSLLDAELIGEIRGGDSFSDIYGFNRFFLGCLPLLSAVVLGRPYSMLPQTYGPFRSRPSRTLAAFLLRRAKTIVTRDRNCSSLVVQLCGKVPEFCPDVAFTMAPVEPDRLTLKPAGATFYTDNEMIGVNVSGLLYMGGYTGRNMFGLRCEYRKLIDELVHRLLESTSARVLLVPHVYGSEQEEEACDAILQAVGNRYADRISAISQSLSEREVKWVIGRTVFFVGSRMHACIAALSQFIPAVGLAYSNKFLGVFDSVGVGDAIIDLRTADESEVIAQTLSSFERRFEFSAKLRSRIPAIQEEVVRAFRGLLSVPPDICTSGKQKVDQ